MSPTQPHRPRCYRCLRPADSCYCAELPSVPTRTRVVILQHPHERTHPFGTARLAQAVPAVGERARAVGRLHRHVGGTRRSAGRCRGALPARRRAAARRSTGRRAPVDADRDRRHLGACEAPLQGERLARRPPPRTARPGGAEPLPHPQGAAPGLRLDARSDHRGAAHPRAGDPEPRRAAAGVRSHDRPADRPRQSRAAHRPAQAHPAAAVPRVVSAARRSAAVRGLRRVGAARWRSDSRTRSRAVGRSPKLDGSTFEALLAPGAVPPLPHHLAHMGLVPRTSSTPSRSTTRPRASPPGSARLRRSRSGRRRRWTGVGQCCLRRAPRSA
jgi:hypothetical protein